MAEVGPEAKESVRWRVGAALQALRQGRGVLLNDDPDLESEVDAIVADGRMTVSAMTLLIHECSTIVCLGILARHGPAEGAAELARLAGLAAAPARRDTTSAIPMLSIAELRRFVALDQASGQPLFPEEAIDFSDLAVAARSPW